MVLLLHNIVSYNNKTYKGDGHNKRTQARN